MFKFNWFKLSDYETNFQDWIWNLFGALDFIKIFWIIITWFTLKDKSDTLRGKLPVTRDLANICVCIIMNQAGLKWKTIFIFSYLHLKLLRYVVVTSMPAVEPDVVILFSSPSLAPVIRFRVKFYVNLLRCYRVKYLFS